MESEDVVKIFENREKLLKRICCEAVKAHQSSKKVSIDNSSASEVIFSFSGSWTVQDWYSQGSFGATKINRKLFPSLRTIGSDQAAYVNQAFQEKFELLITKLQKQIEDVNVGKQIVFTGYSSGGPIAVLATIWYLEQYRFKQKSQIQPLCVTFGSPLVGDHIFSHALRREKWSRCFIHFVTRHDIVPRLFLAPLSSVQPHLAEALMYLQPQSKRGSSHHPNIDLFRAVISSALTLTCHVACKLESTNPLLDTVKSFIELSMYRPFGSYVFLDEKESLVSLNISDAVLQFLFYSCQPSNEAEEHEFFKKSMEGHLAYKTKLDSINKWQIYVGADLDDVLNNAANEFGLSQRGRLNLRAAGESEKKKIANLERIGLKKDGIKKSLEEIAKYRETCADRSVGYYDTFRLQKTNEDYKVNVKRHEQAGFWDEIIELLKCFELPDDFEGRREWIDIGTNYRRLVEPLDVANYYRHLKNEDTGPYMGKPGEPRVPRPKRYRFMQKWLEHENRMEKDSCGESSFWARLEELYGDVGESDFDERAGKVQKDIIQWRKENAIQNDVFNSTLVTWLRNHSTTENR